MMKKTYQVQGMKCMGCVGNVKTALEGLAGVTAVDVDLNSAMVKVEGQFETAQVCTTLTQSGYPAAELAG